MNSVKEYASQWENRERQDIDTLSEWGYEVVDTNRIKILKVGQWAHMQHLSANTQMLKTPVTPMASILLADRAPNILVLVYKSHYTDYLIKELGSYKSFGNITYINSMTFMKDEILDNHGSVLCSFGISPKMKKWIFPDSTGYLKIAQVTIQIVLYCLVYLMLHETSFKIINTAISSISGQNTAS